MTAKKEWVSIGLMVLAALAFLFLMRDYEGSAILFPRMMVILMLCLAAIKAVAEIVRMKKPVLNIDDYAGEPYPWLRIIFVLAAMVVYIWVLENLGFYTTALLFFFLVTLAIQNFKRTPKVIAVRFAYCFGFILFLYLLFSVLLKVQLPKGILV
ncbi:tripartite tricarboxylate transporter TctB family protein [Desulfovibrio sp. OttesenSCG-928-C06]|nr:tripartite tricarboxylate transporter TctB family protein [Desulfovibrio sp. OttesenSCG-928-C06]